MKKLIEVYSIIEIAKKVEKLRKQNKTDDEIYQYLINENNL